MTPVLGYSRDDALLARWDQLLSEQQFALLVARKCSSAELRDANICFFDIGASVAAKAQLPQLVRDYPDHLWVAMTARPEAAEGLRLLRAGARGYCNRLASGKVMATIIDTVTAGKLWAGKQVTDHLLAAALSSEKNELPYATEADRLAALTPREQSIARQVADGHSNKVIAIDSGISERTVKAHLNAIFRKTGMRNRVQLALAMSNHAEPPRRRSNG